MVKLFNIKNLSIGVFGKLISFTLLFYFLLISSENANAAKIYFNDVYKGTGTAYAEQTNSITNIQFITGSGFIFTSTDPADVTFRLTGNNVAGTLTYINASGVKQTIVGQVSRQDKNGSTTVGLYFFTNTNEAYLLVIPGVTTYASNTNVSTSSDPILAVMNAVLSSQNSQPKISVNDVTVNNTDPYAVFTVTLSTAANAVSTFTPSLTAVSATLNTDYTSGMQYYNGSAWVNITTTVSIAQGATSIQIRVPIVNAGANVSRTFNLNTGVVTGSNVINSDGAYGIGTILPAASITTGGTLKQFTSCSGCTITPQSFTVAGSNLSSNLIVSAPTGFELSNTAAGTYSATLSLTPSTGNVGTTTVYVRLSNNGASATAGNFSVTSTNATTRTVAATVNTDNALQFDGVNDYIDLGNTLNLNSLAYTTEAWVYWQGSANPFSEIFTKDLVQSFAITSGNFLHANFGNGTTWGTGLTSTATIPLNKWTHVAVTRSSAGVVNLYIDGVSVASNTMTNLGTTTDIRTIGVKKFLGSTFTGYFNGSIDNIKVWSTEKTASEISASMYTEQNGNEAGLLAYYNFNQGTINGSNSISTLTDNSANTYNGTLNGFALSGNSSNFVAGFIPSITAAGNVTSFASGTTLQLSNILVGGVWSSSNTAFATVDAATGLVTGVSTGSVTISYTICNKVVSYNLNIFTPTLTVSSLRTFTSCSGCTITPQSFTVAGNNLSANAIITAPTGFEMSTSVGGTFSATISLTQTAGNITSTPIYVRLINSNTSATSGNITVASTGAVSKTVTTTVNTDNALNFDGTNDYLTVPTALGSAYNNSAVTIEAWIKTAALSSLSRKDIIAWGSTTAANNVAEFRMGNGKLQFILNDGVKFYSLESANFINTDKWVHVAVVKSGTTVTMYINGQVETATPAGDVTAAPTLNAAAIGVLGYKSGASYGLLSDSYFSGSIDQLRVWNTAKTSSEISTNMFVEMAGNETGLVASYDFNQGIANGSNSISTLNDNTANAYNGTLSGFALSGTSSNFVAGFIPSITAAGNATTLYSGSTLSLTNSLLGGVWSSSNTNYATISNTGVVTGVAVGSVTLTYTICNKTVSYNLTVVEPTITTSALKTFASCSGCTITPQPFTVSGAYLTANVSVTAPTGFEISTTSGGTYTSTLTLTQSGGTVSSTIYARLINSTTTATSGIITLASTGAASKTLTATVNTDNSLNFDGVNDYVELGTNASLSFSGTTSYTLESWVKRSGTTTSNAMIISRQNSAVGGNYVLYITPAGNPGIWREVGGAAALIGTSVIPLDEWHHIASVYDGSTLKLYVDGVLNASASSTGSNTATNFAALKASIGASYSSNTPAYFFKGSIDEVRIWNIARTATEIQNNYLTELAGNETGLVAYYNFNQGIVNGANNSPAITSLTDRTSNGFNGTITNFALTGSSSNIVPGLIPNIAGAAIVQNGGTSNYTNALTGGTWSSSSTAVATINPTTGVVTGVSAGNSTITYTICNKTVSKYITVVDPVISTTGTLTAFSTCATTNSAAQTFTVSGQYLTANIVLTAPAGYELSLTSGGTYTSTLSLTPTSRSVAPTAIYIRTTNSIVNGQSGNISITSTGATTKTVATGNAAVTQNLTASVSISSNATNNSFCSGTSVTFTATPTNGGNSPTYQWKVNGVTVNGATSATYTTSTLSNNDVVTVVMGSSIANCLSGSPATSSGITVTVNNAPNAPGSITGPTTICLSSNQVYSIAAVTGATAYTWVVTGNISATTSTNNVINITAFNTSGVGTIKVLASNVCGVSAYSATLNITVNNTPAPTANFTVSGNAVCLTSAGVNFTNTSTVNATTQSAINAYSWDFGDGSTIATTANASRTYTASGVYDAILTITDANACTSSISNRITVSPLSVAGTASAANATICQGTNTRLTLTGNTGTIQWQSSTDGSTWVNINGATLNTYTTPNLNATTYYQAVVTSGVCSSATSGVVTVTVSPAPSVSLGNISSLFTNSTSFNLPYSNAVGNPNTYSVVTTTPNSLPNFVAINNYGLLSNPIAISIPASASGTYNFNFTVSNSTIGCTSAVIPFTISIAVTPPAGLNYNSPNVYTVGSTIAPLNPTSTGGPISQYSIGPSLPAGLTINPTTGVISGTPSAVSSQTSYIVTGTNSTGTVTATVVITVIIAPPAGLSYTTPNVYTVGTPITALNPTSTGGTITQYTIGPSLPAGLTINPTTGVISGTPSAVSSQTSYIVTGTNSTGTVTATVVITVNPIPNLLPQGSIDAVDYKLFATDTVKIKVNFTSGVSPYTVILSNSNNTKDTITNLLNGDIANLKSVNNNTVYTLFKIIDNSAVVRSSGFTKDTTGIMIVSPNIALTLKADKAVKQPDNSFKTKLLLKIKNSGQIDLRNVQVNANLSNVFPAGIAYVLDSVRVINGNVQLNPSYLGNGTATSPFSVEKLSGANSSISTNAVLDANYLFNTGVNLAINEEADINFYLSIAPTLQSIVLKLQFTSAGSGVLPKNGGYTSQQYSTAISDNGTNLATHPNNTNSGTPMPTYLPLYPIESIGAALKVSNPTPVSGGYQFNFVAKAKNFSNMNLDTVGIFNNFKKTFTSPDTAYIIGTPVITGGTNVNFNSNFNGYSDTLMIDSTAKLALGDSITISYTLFVGTNKTTGSWSNSIFASGHATIDYNYVWDISTDGANPDPNADNDPLEQGKTYFYINYTPPLPPTVNNVVYTYGTNYPNNIGGLVKTYPVNTIPVWCNVLTTLCTPTPPSTPTIIGKYFYQLRSYDTTSLLYSLAYVNDTVTIKPPMPKAQDSVYILGNKNNPLNVGVQVTGMAGSTLNYYFKTIKSNTVPVLGSIASVVNYTVSQVVNQIESDTASFKVTLVDPANMIHLQKIAGEAVLQSNSTFNIPFTFIVTNLMNIKLDSVLITDNLLNAVLAPSTYTVLSVSATGKLVVNANFNGSNDQSLTKYASSLDPNAVDTARFTINVVPNGFAGTLNNAAVVSAHSPYGNINVNSSSKTRSTETSKLPTPFIIPNIKIDIPEGFSPNRDGVNDKFVIIKPYNTILDLEIFNRWGNVVYTNNNYNNEWDGKGTSNFLGQDLMDGGYYYTLKAKFADGTVQIFKGFVLIQR